MGAGGNRALAKAGLKSGRSKSLNGSGNVMAGDLSAQ